MTKEIYARFKREKLNPTQPASARSQVCFCDSTFWRWIYESDHRLCAALGFLTLLIGGIGAIAAVIVYDRSGLL